MKIIALCLALVASLACSEAALGLDEIAQGFVDRLPVEELKEWVHEKYENDEDFQELVAYLGSDHFVAINEHILSHQWMQDFIQYLKDNGIPPQFQKTLHSLFRLPHHHNPKFNTKEKPEVDWELLHLVQEAAEIVKPHVEELTAYYESIKDEPKAKEFIAKLKAKDCEEFAVEYVYPFQNFQELIQILEEGNLPVTQILKWIKDTLWG